MGKIIETIYAGRDNTIELELWADGVRVDDLSGVSRMVLDLGDGTSLDSAVIGAGAGQPFDWTQGAGKLVLSLGGQGLSADSFYRHARLIVFDTDHPNGLVWSSLEIKVK